MVSNFTDDIYRQLANKVSALPSGRRQSQALLAAPLVVRVRQV